MLTYGNEEKKLSAIPLFQRHNGIADMNMNIRVAADRLASQPNEKETDVSHFVSFMLSEPQPNLNSTQL